jgi:hypothetical protein
MLLNYILEVPASDLGRDTNYSEVLFCGSLQSTQANDMAIPHIRLRTLSSTSLLILLS